MGTSPNRDPMRADPAIDSSALAMLACPACHSDLRAEDTRLVCTSCDRAYPILDGIPVLLATRAELPAEDR